MAARSDRECAAHARCLRPGPCQNQGDERSARRRAPRHRRRHARGAVRVVRRARSAGLSGPPGPRRRLEGPGDLVLGDPHPPGRAPGRARGGVPVRHRHRPRDPRGGRRPDREGPPPAGRRPARRVRTDALPGPRRLARAAHAVHQLAGRLRGGLPVLRDGRARPGPRPRDRRDRRPGPPRRPQPRGRREAPDQRRVHGHGRAAAQPRPGAGVDRRAQRPAPAGPRRAAHHGVDLGGGARASGG